MSIEEGLRRAAAVVHNYDRDGVISAEVLGPYAATVMEYADQSGLSFASPQACGTTYDSHKSEIQMWLFARMLSEYVAGLLLQKADEGHCQNHRKPPDYQPCPDTKPMHLEMARRFRDDLSDLVRQIDARLGAL